MLAAGLDALLFDLEGPTPLPLCSSLKKWVKNVKFYRKRLNKPQESLDPLRLPAVDVNPFDLR